MEVVDNVEIVCIVKGDDCGARQDTLWRGPTLKESISVQMTKERLGL